uniref:uDENN domain-containing protein n=1 Tax=Accipiter nisus TaxID=211598 RepID=A0A8B9MAW9_9AVES
MIHMVRVEIVPREGKVVKLCDVVNIRFIGPTRCINYLFFSPQEVLQTLTKFCFPFYVDSHAVNQVGQNFTFVLTDIDSKQRFGFCRLSSGAKSCFCILR